MARYSGANLRVMLAVSNTDEAIAIGVSEWTCSMTRDEFEVTESADDTKVYVKSKPDARGNISSFWHDDDDTLYTAAAAQEHVKMYAYPEYVAAPTKYAYGYVDVDWEIGVPVGGAITANGTWVAAGSFAWN